MARLPALLDTSAIEPDVVASPLLSASAIPRALAEVGALSDPCAATMRYQSPLRYPGAKAGISKYIASVVDSAARALGRPSLFVEPFAGGAATSLRLAGLRVAERVLLADADPLVAQFWRVAADRTSWLVDRMWDEEISLDRWDYWRAYEGKSRDDSELAVKCLYLNRTTFSGILHGRAGPIGGRAQKSPYRIDCRFNRAALQARLEYVGDLYRSNRLVDVWCKDWEATLDDVAEWYPQLLPDRVVAYLDPPYLEKSSKLYATSFDPAGGCSAERVGTELPRWKHSREHFRLAEHLRRRARYRWILSYDHSDRLLESPLLYRATRMNPSIEDKTLLGVKEWRITRRLLSMQYTASGALKRSPSLELLLTTLPPSSVPEVSATGTR